MLIVYCEKCDRRISDAELSTGKAKRVDDNKALCPECAPAHTPLPTAGPARVRTPPSQVTIPARSSSGGTTAVRIPKTVRAGSSRKGDHAEPELPKLAKSKSNNTTIVVCAVAGVILLGGAITLVTGNSAPAKKDTEVAKIG